MRYYLRTENSLFHFKAHEKSKAKIGLYFVSIVGSKKESNTPLSFKYIHFYLIWLDFVLSFRIIADKTYNIQPLPYFLFSLHQHATFIDVISRYFSPLFFNLSLSLTHLSSVIFHMWQCCNRIFDVVTSFLPILLHFFSVSAIFQLLFSFSLLSVPSHFSVLLFFIYLL